MDIARLASDGCAYLSFTDIRDAVKAFELLRATYPRAVVHYLKRRTFLAKGDGGLDVSKISDYEGHVVVQASFDHLSRKLPSAMEFFQLVKDEMSNYGMIKVHCSPPSSVPHVKNYYFEYFDSRCALQAITALNNSKLRVSSLPIQRMLLLILSSNSSSL